PDRMAYYGDRLAELTLERPLRAGGKVSLRRGVTDSTVLLGFFHARDSTASNPAQDSGLPRDFLGVMIEGPSRGGFYFRPAYRLHSGTEGYGRGPDLAHILPDGAAHTWSLAYTPAETGGRIIVQFDGTTTRLEFPDRGANTHFDRFGLITT